MKILFINLSNLRFTVATPETEPLGGTESAICYLARNLAARGHDVTLIVKRPEGAAEMIARVRHAEPELLRNGDYLAAQNFDTIIVSNAPVAGPSLRDMAPRAKILLWNHLAPNHSHVASLSEPIVRDSFDGIVYVSDWQRQVTEIAFTYQKPFAIIGNGFAPAFADMFSSAAELLAVKENRAAYTTTPFRGLPVLIDAMARLGTQTHLDIYSSMKVYQAERDDQHFGPLFAYAVQNPHIATHGAVAQSELAQRLRPVSFFTYPSTYAETFCIAALEARAAGMKVLTTATAALPEILGAAADYIPATLEDPPKMIDDFRQMLRANVRRFQNKPEEWAEERFADLQFVNRTCTWAERAKAWEDLLQKATV